MEVGLTVMLPEAATEPMPWSMLTLVAFVVLHVSVTSDPEVPEVGLTEIVAVGAGSAMVAVLVVVPPKPTTVKV